MPKLPRDPHCADCQTGVIICKHRGKCHKPVYIACPSCCRDRCGEQECVKLVCCVAMPALQSTPPESKIVPSVVVVSCVENNNAPATVAAAATVPVSPLLFRAIAQLLLLSQDKKACCISCKEEAEGLIQRSGLIEPHFTWLALW